MERVILVSPEKETSEDFTTHFNYSLELKENSMIALKSLSMWNSWHNISSEYNNNKIKFSKDNGKTYETLVFVNGNYTITDINNYFFSYFEVTDMRDLPFIFGIYTPTGRFGITFNPNVKVDFKEGNINELLGFNKANVYPRAKEKNVVAENYGNISKGIDTIEINCNIVKDSWYGRMKVNNLLFEFTPTEKPYSHIIIKEKDPEFIRMHTNNISSIRTWVTDQNRNKINLNKFPVRYKLLIKQ